MFHASYSWSGPQLPKGCGCIGFLSPMHKKDPRFLFEKRRGQPREFWSIFSYVKSPKWGAATNVPHLMISGSSPETKDKERLTCELLTLPMTSTVTRQSDSASLIWVLPSATSLSVPTHSSPTSLNRSIIPFRYL